MSELREAAERLLRAFHEDEPSPLSDVMREDAAEQLRDDAMALSRHVLATVREDDMLLADAAWVKSLPGCVEHSEGHILSFGHESERMRSSFWMSRLRDEWYINVNSGPFILNPTRGQVRALLAALGITEAK